MDIKKEKHFVARSSTAEENKDTWQTPKEFFSKINAEFNFDLDACASSENKLCDLFFSAENSALENDWAGDGIKSAFINPPYSQTRIFLNRAAQQAKAHNVTVVALVNANTDTVWFKECYQSASEIRLITGRISFVGANGKRGGNTKGQCLIIWRGSDPEPCRITLVDR